MSPLVFSLLVFSGSMAIGTVAVIAGTGGGVLFTTLFLGFTAIHPDIVRATGLLAALCGTRMAGRRFLNKGLANIRLVLVLGSCYTLFAVVGALVGLELTRHFGDFGIALIKLLLGIIVILVGVVYLLSKGMDYPVVEEVDRFTRWLGLNTAYYEVSRQTVIDYQVAKTPLGLLLMCGVGFISGTFGLGAGWAITPALNLGLKTPLKVAVATSAVIISLGDTGAVFPYLMSDSIIPIFAVPAVLGLIVGAEIGSRIAVRIGARFVKYVLILIMVGTGLQLVYKGLAIMGIF